MPMGIHGIDVPVHLTCNHLKLQVKNQFHSIYDKCLFPGSQFMIWQLFAYLILNSLLLTEFSNESAKQEQCIAFYRKISW